GGRYAGKNSFFAGHAPAHVLGVVLTDEHEFVYRLRIVDGRHVGLRPLANAGNARALLRLCAYDEDVGVLLLEVARYARNRPRSAHGADEMCDAPLRLLPQLGPCGFVVNARV